VSVEAIGIRKQFGDVEAICGADLIAPAGALTAVVGPSGCGKTTMLRLIAGFEQPDAGRIAISGQTVTDAHRAIAVAPERRRVGMVFQHLALFPHLDVARNIAYGLRGRAKAERTSRVAELLRLVDLAGMESRFPDQLSGGQAQRVALARALAPHPEVVLLDEPFSSLDVTLRADVRTQVREILRRENVTAILVTHDQDEALALGDHVAVMLRGQVAQLGAPEHVYRHPATAEVATFLGDANLLPGNVRGGMISTELGQVATSAADGPSVALLRAEDIDLVADGESRVLNAEYFGHDQVVTVALPSGTTIRARLHARRRLDPGTLVTPRIVATDVVAFRPASSGSGD
jgi:iron(III) transport system ATP-binding protein